YEVIPLCDGWAPLPLSDEIPRIDVDWDRERARFPWAFPDGDRTSWAWHVHAFLVRHPDGIALVDTGIGHLGRPPFDVAGRLDEELATFGVVPTDVRDVVLTHLHGDHAGGVCRPDGTPRFPEARHHVHPDDWTFFAEHRAPGDFTGRFAMASVEEAGLLDLDAPDHEVGPGLRLHHAPGHTPGHRVARLDGAGGGLWLLGDLLHTTAQIASPSATSEHDEDPELGAHHRRTIVERALAERDSVGISHFARPFGRIVGRPAAPTWEPA
ncbi:MAG TPA: MBL fold metallo-hydrolase, partial [Actinomycetota bacterium]|nr:MBL fold metallo-hydrolase [Actinomycetota bacterium]